MKVKDAQVMSNSTANDCWNRIGTLGQATCPNLEDFVHCRNCPVYSQEGRTLLDRESTEDYLVEWTALLAQEKQVEESDRTSVVVFRLRKEWLALKTNVLERVVSMRVVHKIPHRSNAVLLGLANVRGELMLCVSLSQILGLEEEGDHEKTERPRNTAMRMIVVNHGGEQWVFPVDEVEGIHRVSASRMEKVPTTVSRAPMAYSQGIFRLGPQRVAFLDEHLLLGTLKRSMHWQSTT
jgi:chemotaxis-related protein WspD